MVKIAVFGIQTAQLDVIHRIEWKKVCEVILPCQKKMIQIYATHVCICLKGYIAVVQNESKLAISIN